MQHKIEKNVRTELKQIEVAVEVIEEFITLTFNKKEAAYLACIMGDSSKTDRVDIAFSKQNWTGRESIKDLSVSELKILDDQCHYKTFEILSAFAGTP